MDDQPGPVPLEPLTVAIDPTAIVAGAFCTMDYYSVHHDARAARAKGLPDIILNSATLEGYLLRYVSEQVEPQARVRGIKYRLLQPTIPGDELQFIGARTRDAAQDVVQIEVAHQRGLVCTARVTLA